METQFGMDEPGSASAREGYDVGVGGGSLVYQVSRPVGSPTYAFLINIDVLYHVDNNVATDVEAFLPTLKLDFIASSEICLMC